MKISGRSKLLAALVIGLFFLSIMARTGAQQLDITTTEYGTLSKDASRFWVEFGKADPMIKHFTYLVGPSVDVEPSGQDATANEVFKYGQVDTTTNQIKFTENVTNDLVYPYQYNFVVDSQDRIHTAYVTNNYTVYYAMRDTNGVWTSQAINSNDTWFGWSPTIALGAEEQPRLVYSASFQQNASTYYGIGADLTSRRTVIYSVKDGNTWQHYDVGDNHGFLAKSQTVFNLYYPSLEISNGSSFITFNNRLSQAAASREYYMAIPEIPTSIVNNASDSFTNYQNGFAIVSATIQTIYTRAAMEFVGDGIVIAVGTFSFGGLSIGYTHDKFARAPASDRDAQKALWESHPIDDSVISRESLSVDMVKSGPNEILVSYSVYNLFDQINGKYTQNIFVKSYSFITDASKISDGSQGMIQGGIQKITDKLNVKYEYTNILSKQTDNGTVFEIDYIKGNDGSYGSASFIKPAPVHDNALSAGLTYLAISGVLIVTFYILIQKFVTSPVEKREILPHEINMREAMKEH